MRMPRQPAIEPVTCPTCRAPYRPRLTGWSCPVCGTTAPGAETRRSRRLANADDRLLGIVLVATIANVLLLGALAMLVLTIS